MSDMSVFSDDNRSRNNEDAPVAHTASSGGFYMSQMIIPCLFGSLMLAFIGGAMIFFARDVGYWGYLLVIAGIALLLLAGYVFYLPIKLMDDAAVTTDGSQEASHVAHITESLPPGPVLSDEAQKQLNKIENKDVAALCLMFVGFAIPFALLSHTPSYIDTQTIWLIATIGAACIIVGGCLGNKYRKQAVAIRLSAEQTNS